MAETVLMHEKFVQLPARTDCADAWTLAIMPKTLLTAEVFP